VTRGFGSRHPKDFLHGQARQGHADSNAAQNDNGFCNGFHGDSD
jgi:hypothetical protein